MINNCQAVWRVDNDKQILVYEPHNKQNSTVCVRKGNDRQNKLGGERCN